MEFYYKRTTPIEEHCQIPKKAKVDTKSDSESTKQKNPPINLVELEADPGIRVPIDAYPVNDQDEIRRRYMLKGPFQPYNHIFPLTQFGKKYRRFNPNWFKEHPNWLEYSVVKDAAFCLCCYIFRSWEQDYFVGRGFSNWKKKERFQIHVGGPGSAHNYAWTKCTALMNQKQNIAIFFNNQSNKDQVEYRIRLESSVNSIRFLLRQGLAFRGHDESTASGNQGNFLELLKFMGCLKTEIKDVTLQNEEIESGRGLNQSTNLKRHGDTRWGSHYGTLLSLLNLYSSTIEVLEIIIDDVSNSEQRFDATNTLLNMQSYSFAFTLHLLRNILGVSNELSKALQRKDQDIANAINLVKVCKLRLQDMRENGWDAFTNQVSSFCESHDINVPDMNDIFVPRGRSRRKTYEKTNLHHYRVELYYSIIDMQLQELNNRFDEVNTTLLLCISCLVPDHLFVAFEKQKLLQLAGYYPNDFSPIELMVLDDQLENYIVDMRSSTEFSELKGISNLAMRMVETGRDKVYPLVYQLLTLSLILPVATASVERVFSGMHIVKTKLRNRIGDQWLNDSLIIYIERAIFDCISNECIMERFQNMKTRRGNL